MTRAAALPWAALASTSVASGAYLFSATAAWQKKEK
jgi:hypothetical protein